jgi:metal-sulfur cluster biosynthetic enzyme
MITKEQVLEALRTVVDPEIGVNIVDLGLVYNVEIEGDKVEVEMTLTIKGCPLATAITQVAKQRVEMIEGVKEVRVHLVWDPPWNSSMVSDELKKRFGLG